MIRFERLSELYAIKERRADKLRLHMDAMCEFGSFSKEAIEAYDELVTLEGQYKIKCDALTDEVGMVEGMFAVNLLDAVFPKSISRYLKCLDVCGIEVIGQ